MRIKLLNLYTGPTGRHDPGAVIDVPDAEGAQLLAGGYAHEVISAGEVETAAFREPVKRPRGRPPKNAP